MKMKSPNFNFCFMSYFLIFYFLLGFIFPSLFIHCYDYSIESNYYQFFLQDSKTLKICIYLDTLSFDFSPQNQTSFLCLGNVTFSFCPLIWTGVLLSHLLILTFFLYILYKNSHDPCYNEYDALNIFFQKPFLHLKIQRNFIGILAVNFEV